ncbi:MAG: hypothetical protein IH587_05075, partial [Anaerolineae bacterium]|nr:hypothetical protein [Anaerolineae bacterium]
MKPQLIWTIILTLVSLSHAVGISNAQSPAIDGVTGRLVYVRTLEDGSSELVSRYPEGSLTLPIGSTEYYTFSPNGLYVAISDMETPTDIRIYRTDTASLALQQPWLPQWHEPR